MTRGLNLLSARTVATLIEPGRYADGGGLYLQVRKRSDAIERLWVFRFKRGSRDKVREKTLSIGTARDITLASARSLASGCRTKLAEGKDPREALLKNGGVPTFGELVDDLLDSILPAFKNEKHKAQWKMTLGETYCRSLRSIPVDKITTDDILAVLKPIWLTKPETASRIRGRIERVIDGATVRRLRSGDNPARWRGHLSHLLSKPDAIARGHHAALPWADLPSFMQDLKKLDSISALALEFTILTIARTSETINAAFVQVNEGDKVWTRPAAIMKAKREHRIPLTPRSLEIIQEMKKFEGAWLFPGQSLNDQLSNMAMAECLKGFGLNVTVHGFRSTFRDWVSEATTFPDALAEAALAHIVGDKTERAYKRGDALEKRRELMAAWERYCLQGASNVIHLTPKTEATA